jgi:hypothetical protein
MINSNSDEARNFIMTSSPYSDISQSLGVSVLAAVHIHLNTTLFPMDFHCFSSFRRIFNLSLND